MKYPSLGWEKLESDARLKCPTFTMTTVDGYFVERKDEDGLPSENYKSLVGDNKARHLFRKGHVQNIEIATRGTEIFFSAQCIPEMKSDKPYFLRLAVSSDGTGNVMDVLHAECKRCPAGKGPFASCKHVAALFYSLEDFCLLGYNTKEDVACTDELQTWNRPRKRKAEPQLAADIDWKRPRLGTGQANAPTTRAVADRRHPDDRGKTQARVLEVVKESAAQGRLTGMALIVGDQSAVELVRKKQKEKRLWRTKALKKKWEKLKARQVVLDAQKFVAHDHCYFTTPVSCKFDLDVPSLSDLVKESAAKTYYKEHVELSETALMALEGETRGQAKDALWFSERKKRITASLAKTVACRREDTPPDKLVNQIVKRRSVYSVAMAYGIDNEDVARDKYMQIMKTIRPSLSTTKLGLCVSISQPWLAGSPDGAVTDPSEKEEGLLEIKCPFQCTTSTFRKCARKSSFCLRFQKGKLSLRRSHAYYYQMQVQMFVSKKAWCDLCVFSPSELHIERVRYDPDFLLRILPKMQQFYCNSVLPHLSSPDK